MKSIIISFLFFICFNFSNSQNIIDQEKVKEDFNELIINLSKHYAYLNNKKVDLKCISEYYEKQIPNIKSKVETVLFFEYLLNEFYDSHLILNTNTNSSYRLYPPIYVTINNSKPVISNVWHTQLNNFKEDIIGSEILKINGINFNSQIEKFPSHCNDKQPSKIREWISNKIVAGKYDEPRILTLKLTNNEVIEFDLDELEIKTDSSLLSVKTKDNIGIIRINNSLGNNSLISEFDNEIDNLMHTKGLVIDLRNTVDGGNSYVARGIMSRFINELKPYQKHSVSENYDEKTFVKRTWVEHVSPREKQYKNPVVVLVGRWTGSMGEGLAIGFEAIDVAEIVGSEMERLAGEINSYNFKNQNFGYRLPTAKLFHVNGTPREEYVPTNYIKQTTIKKDEVLEKGIELINAKTN